MPKWTIHELTEEFHRASVSGWLPMFQTVAEANQFSPEFLMAIGSRETNLTNIKGDYRAGVYHGFGIMQVDVGTDPAFCAAWRPDQVRPSIERGAAILAGKRATLAARGITDPKAVAAAYNTGAGNVLRSLSKGLDADRTTTGHDYGADVLARTAVFQDLLADAALHQ